MEVVSYYKLANHDSLRGSKGSQLMTGAVKAVQQGIPDLGKDAVVVNQIVDTEI